LHRDFWGKVAISYLFEQSVVKVYEVVLIRVKMLRLMVARVKAGKRRNGKSKGDGSCG
jgi:hypothetical protein